MSRRWKLLGGVLAALGIGGQAIALAMLVGPLALLQPVPAVAVYLAASILIVVGVYRMLPDGYRRPGPGVWLFLASTVLCMPVMGPLGLALAIVPALYWAYRPQPSPWQSLSIPELPARPIDIDPDDVFLRDGLATVLTHFDDATRRQRAILATAHLPDRDAVPVLQRGLGDASDEVRLLAFSKLDAIEGDLEHQLSRASERAESRPAADGYWHEQIASLAWEFSYLGLVSNSVEQLMLERALSALDVAIARRATVQRRLLQSRCYLGLGRLDEAGRALDQACALGLAADDAAPRRAEIHFQRGDYRMIPKLLDSLSDEASRQPVMQPVVDYWRRVENGVGP